MDIRTHQQVDRQLCGDPVAIKEGYCLVRFLPTFTMRADDSGLVHGGFVFGAADYAAMLAVNHPNVVLAGASVKFLKPVKAGDKVDAEARVTKAEGKKRSVSVTVRRDGEAVFEGELTCFVPERHVLAPSV